MKPDCAYDATRRTGFARISNLKQTARNSSVSVDFSVLIRARSTLRRTDCVVARFGNHIARYVKVRIVIVVVVVVVVASVVVVAIASTSPSRDSGSATNFPRPFRGMHFFSATVVRKFLSVRLLPEHYGLL